MPHFVPEWTHQLLLESAANGIVFLREQNESERSNVKNLYREIKQVAGELPECLINSTRPGLEVTISLRLGVNHNAKSEKVSLQQQ